MLSMVNIMGEKKPREAKKSCGEHRAANRFCGGRLCDDEKGTAAGLNAEVGEHVDRPVANCNGG